MHVFFTLFCLLFLCGCGGHGDIDRPLTQTAGGSQSTSISNSVLLDTYASLSVRYSTTASGAFGRAYYRDVEYNGNGNFKTASPTFFDDFPYTLNGYNFTAPNDGSGLVSVTQNNIALTYTLSTITGGSMAVFVMPPTPTTTSILAVHMKSASSLTFDQFLGNFGFVSMNVSGRAVSAELTFSSTQPNLGLSTGVAFVTSTVGQVSLTPTTASSETFSLNANLNKLNFINVTWHVAPGASLAMSSETSASGGNHLSLLMKPTQDLSLSGIYNVYQWATFSPSNLVTATATSVLPSTAVTLGQMEFVNQTARFTNILGIAAQSFAYERQPGTKSMWRFPSLEGTNTSDQRIRFFVSEDRRVLLGTDYANDKDARAALLIGLKTTP